MRARPRRKPHPSHRVTGRRSIWTNGCFKPPSNGNSKILGEALKNLRSADAETAARIPNVHAIIATRNILVHAYAQVDQRRVWEILIDDLPELIPVLEGLLAVGDEAEPSRQDLDDGLRT
jgi:hypothetical protein